MSLENTSGIKEVGLDVSTSFYIEYGYGADYKVVWVNTDTKEVIEERMVKWKKPKSDSFIFNIMDYSEPDSLYKQHCIAANKLMYKAYSDWCKENKWTPSSLKECEKEDYPEIFPSWKDRNPEAWAELQEQKKK